MKKLITIILIALSLCFAKNTIEEIELTAKERLMFPSSFWSGVDVVDELTIVRVSGSVALTVTTETNVKTGVFDSIVSNYPVQTNMRFQLYKLDVQKDGFVGGDGAVRFDIQANAAVKKSITLGANDHFKSITFPIIPEITAPTTSAKACSFINGNESISNEGNGLASNDVIRFTHGTSWPGELAINTDFWVATVLTTTNFTVSLEEGAPHVTFSSNGAVDGSSYQEITSFNVVAQGVGIGAGTNITVRFDAWAIVYVPEN